MHGGVYRGARAPGLDVLHHDGCARIGAAEAVGAREQSVPGQSVNEAGCHLLILHVDVGVVHLGPGAEPLVLRVAGAPLERVRENVVEDVDRAVQGLGDVKQIVQRRARKVRDAQPEAHRECAHTRAGIMQHGSWSFVSAWAKLLVARHAQVGLHFKVHQCLWLHRAFRLVPIAPGPYNLVRPPLLWQSHALVSPHQARCIGLHMF